MKISLELKCATPSIKAKSNGYVSDDTQDQWGCNWSYTIKCDNLVEVGSLDDPWVKKMYGAYQENCLKLIKESEDDFQKTKEKLHNRIRRLKRTQEAKEKEVQEKKAKVDEEVEAEE